MLLQFIRDEEGTTAIEYALVASLVGLTVVSAMHSLAEASTEMFGQISSAVDAAVP